MAFAAAYSLERSKAMSCSGATILNPTYMLHTNVEGPVLGYQHWGAAGLLDLSNDGSGNITKTHAELRNRLGPDRKMTCPTFLLSAGFARSPKSKVQSGWAKSSRDAISLVSLWPVLVARCAAV